MPRVANSSTSPAPSGGWNARDALANMPAGDAVILDNFVPYTTECRLRAGSADYVTDVPGDVETLAVYNKADGSHQMFAAASGNIYNVTTAGAVGAPVQSGLTSNRWQYMNFATSGGKFMYMVNGVDKPRLWNGTTWVAVDGASTPAITGVTTTNLISVNVYQNRLWFVEKDTLKVWYLPVSSIGGAALAFDLSAIFGGGGYLMAMGTWTLDSGNGMDDHAVFVSSEGQIAVYRGTDPASASNWFLVGVYRVGAPVGRRCMTQYASDLLIISADGLLPMSRALASSRVNTGISLTDKIQLAATEAVSNYKTNFGWEAQLYPEENLLLMNVPVPGGSEQYVMFTLSGSWCRFTGWDARCFARMGSELFFGTTGKVVKAWTGVSDSGQNITGEALAAFQYHNGMSLKRYTMCRPIISVDSSAVAILMGLNVDFDQTAPVGSPTLITVPIGVWDTSVWDSAPWSSGFVIQKNWQTISGIGYCAAIHFKITSSGAQIRWQSTDYVFEQGRGFV